MDLKELAMLKMGDPPPRGSMFPPRLVNKQGVKKRFVGNASFSGFAGMSCRDGKKPIIGLINGHAHGGGFEMALNFDLTLASPNATFRAADCQHGLAALAGAYPRLCRIADLQRTMDLSLTARRPSAAEAEEWGIVLRVIPEEELLREGLKMARAIASLSPHAIFVAREAVRNSLNYGVNESIRDMRLKHLDSILEGKALGEGLSNRIGLKTKKSSAKL
ncbi:hypothetical protein N7532_000057 [Penicillium argentinense]|uniref:Enoyl-CoA hydratase n=1 Tax=Penicillium argentinense TaxID=1131581 RepID=A0A9W9G620_9EURO|nr:uncharacterized protein N7532_000057 [Penicillium argentinense]KAJ5112012.1 hypothetical protein N7532_000057 [Penicillium argentinense]